MWKLKLTDEQATELAGLRRDPTLTPAERDRVEMVALSAAGWPVRRIAGHLGCCAETVRRGFRRFRTEGWAMVRHRPPGPPPATARREQVETAVRGLVAQPRTWTANQVAAALAEQGIRLSARQTRRYLKRLGAGWRRTKRSLAHKQDPVRVARARETLALFANGHKQAR